MTLYTAVLFLVHLVILSSCQVDDLERIPPVHAMDDFHSCKAEGNTFCRIQFTLRPNSFGENKAWQIIQTTKNNSEYFNRDVIYRFRCVSKEFKENMDEIEVNVTTNENAMLQNFSLNAKLDHMECTSYNKETPLTRYDYTILYSTLCWMVLIAIATICDVANRAIPEWKASQFVKSLSVLSNWEDIRKPIPNEDYQKLSSIQGIRTLNMAKVVVGHTVLHALFSFTSDTNYIENFYKNRYKKFSMNMGLHIVQTNFLISGWLLANYMHSFVEKNKQLTVKISLKLILLRYLRLLPALAFLICWQMSNWPRALTAGPPLERSIMDFKACQKNWWATLLLVNNFLLSSDMCNLGTWYLSNDFQMYVLTIILFYLMVNFNITDGIIVWSMAISCFVHAFFIYAYNLGVIFDFTPENAKVKNSVGSANLKILYTSFYSNYGSYAIGLIFGGLYHKFKYHKIKLVEKTTYYWLFFFYGLQLLAVHLSMFQYSRLLSAFIGASIKPIFVLGTGIGILGMTHGVGGIIKKFYESKFLEFLSKLTYCVYIIHFPIVFGRYAMMNEPVHLTEKILVISIISDLVISFAAGLVLHLVIERPFNNILKKLIQTESSSKIKRG